MPCKNIKGLSFCDATQTKLRLHRLNSTLSLALLRLIIAVLILFSVVHVFYGNFSISLDLQTAEKENKISMYAVFSASTPSGVSHRGHDYAYQLPLTALAWERLGFKSIVLIVGSRCEWENEPALKHVLVHLESKSTTTVIFLEANFGNRTMLSQVARIFVSNLPESPAKPNDYLITSDADLWPIHKGHYLPRTGKNLVLVHSLCCGFFDWKGKSYREYPMGNIGANVKTWREIINGGQRTLPKDVNSILKYIREEFGESSLDPVVFAKENWFFDQRLISIRIEEWIERHSNDTVYRVSDEGWTRLDRINWNARKLNKIQFAMRYDAHMPTLSFLPEKWEEIIPLVSFMYGPNSPITKYCDKYTKTFLSKVKNYYFDILP